MMLSYVTRKFLAVTFLLMFLFNAGYGSCPNPDWSGAEIYVNGDEVTYESATWRAKWWTRGDIPGVNDVWEYLNDCKTVEEGNDTLIYNGPGDTLTIRTKYNAMVLFYNPDVNYYGQIKKAANHWNSPDILIPQYIENLRKATSGMVDWSVKYQYEINAFPPDTDPSVDLTAENIFMGTEVEGDYEAILLNPEYDIVNRINSGDIDAIWIMSPPHTVFSETAMAGSGAYRVNGKVFGNFPTDRKFVIYGFNYERDVACMMENTGHMAEWIMGTKIYKLADAPKKHAVNTFQSFDIEDPNTVLEQRVLDDWLYFFSPELTNYDFLDGKCNAFDDAQVGNIHFAPNAHKNYSWGGCFQDFERTDEEFNVFGPENWSRTNYKYVGAGSASKSMIYDYGWKYNGTWYLDHTRPYIMRNFQGYFNITLNSNTVNGDAGFIFNATEYNENVNSGKGYYVGLNADGDKIFLAEFNNSTRTIVAEKAVALDYGVEYKVNILVDGDLIEVRLNEETTPSISYNNKTFDYGCVGVAINGSNAIFDNIYLDPIVYCNADNWYNFPDISGEKRRVSGLEWNRDQETYFKWWFEHLPKNVGFHSDTDFFTGKVTSGILNNWLAYIFDINVFDTIGYYGAVRFPKPDTEAPAIPVNLSSSISGNDVHLTWQEPADNIGVTRYEIHRNDTLIIITPNTYYSEKLYTSASSVEYKIAARDAGANLSEKVGTVITLASSANLVVARNVSPENGTVTGGGVVTVGVATEITATAGTGYRFDHWVLETSNVSVANVNSATTTVVVSNNSEVAAVTAIFEEVKSCTTQQWVTTGVYVADDVVCHNGSHWRAKWWTTGAEPGTTGEWGVWELQEACPE